VRLSCLGNFVEVNIVVFWYNYSVEIIARGKERENTNQTNLPTLAY
jgi:hypothetical protein